MEQGSGLGGSACSWLKAEDGGNGKALDVV